MNATDAPRDSTASTSRRTDSMRWSSSTTLIGGSRASKSRRTLESVSRIDLESPNSSTETQVVTPLRAGERLQQLVDQEIFRIDRTSLPGLLNVEVENAEAILQHFRPQLCFSRDDRFILPRNQMDDIAVKLQKQASVGPVDLHAFAAEHDITFDSVNNLIETRANRDWPRVIIDVDHHSYLCSHAFTDSIKSRISQIVTTPGTEARDLTCSVGHNVPSAVLVALATEATSKTSGEVRFAGDHVVFIPSCSSCAEDKERQQTIQAEQEAQQHLTNLIESHLWCPLHLYAAGIIETTDNTLKSDLEAAALTHFTQTVIPNILAIANEQHLFKSPHHQPIHVQLYQAQHSPTTFTNLQQRTADIGSLLSFAPPSESLVLQTKTNLLTTTAQTVQSLTNPLNILQNLIWILLATSGPGLFMSSVKYTSRMIKFYDVVSDDGEVAGMLRLWWEKVSAGMGDEEDLRQMRELARDAVEAWREERWG